MTVLDTTVKVKHAGDFSGYAQCQIVVPTCSQTASTRHVIVTQKYSAIMIIRSTSSSVHGRTRIRPTFI